MDKKVAKRFGMFALATALLAGLSGCASTANNPKDPLEGFNRAMFSFNDGLDKAIIKPVAQGYDYVLPQPVQTGVGNFFGNIADVFIAVNNLLQGKPADAASDAGRFLLNTTIGVLGVFDVAEGAYVVWPFIGSRTVRDTAGYVVDVAVDPVWNVDHVPTRNSLAVLRLVDTRASLLPAEKVIDDAALDKYTYMRDAYLQRRKSLVYDGNPPREKLED